MPIAPDEDVLVADQEAMAPIVHYAQLRLLSREELAQYVRASLRGRRRRPRSIRRPRIRLVASSATSVVDAGGGRGLRTVRRCRCLHAYKAGCEVVAFSRDRDLEAVREEVIERGIAAAKRDYPASV